MGKYDVRILLSLRRAELSIRYNGFGGKVEPGETPLSAATRELEVGSYLQDNGCLLLVAKVSP